MSEDPDRLLTAIVNLVAQRDFRRDIDHKQNLLDCIARLLTNAGYGHKSDVF